MGQDKAWMLWQGRPLIAHIVAAAQSQFPIRPQKIWINGRASDIEACHEISEYVALDMHSFAGLGPLAGIHTGLLHSDAEWLWILPCDALHIPSDLLQRLMAVALTDHPSTCDAVIVETLPTPLQPRRTHPVWCLLHRRAAPHVASALTQRELRLASFFERLSTRKLTLRQGESIENINRPEDWPTELTQRPVD